MLLNNLHALRVHTQGLFEEMGGEEVSLLPTFICSVVVTVLPSYSIYIVHVLVSICRSSVMLLWKH